MSYPEFNKLHPTHFIRERGWKPEPNPFLPKPRRAGHGYWDKHIFIYATQLWYDIDANTNMVGRARRNMKDAQVKTFRQARTIRNVRSFTVGLTSILIRWKRICLPM